ncbi:auxin-induced in root cultures protein 12-like [Nymphaea colorata]|nr:auxin-induced in root cultures protein 12-like [Nymphaea colorata]
MASSTQMIFLLSIVGALISTASACCKSESFHNRRYARCTDLPVLNSSLHWTYSSADHSLDIAYRAPPSAPGGWVAWAINPSRLGMVGSQALVAYVDHGKVTVFTTSVDSYGPSMRKMSLSFPVWNLAGETTHGADIVIYAKLRLPWKNTTINQVWQSGTSVSNGVPQMHPMVPDHFRSTGRLNLLSGLPQQALRPLHRPPRPRLLPPLDLFPLRPHPRHRLQGCAPAPGGWVAWAINPAHLGMVGSQALVAYVDRGKVNVFTTSVDSYSPSMRRTALSFPVLNLAGETTSGGNIVIYAKLRLPGRGTIINQVWQSGPVTNGVLHMHPMTGGHLQSSGRLNLL